MLPFLTSDIPGVGGVIKQSDEDFVVEEIPAYFPSGTGEHLYVTVEKRGITTLEAIRRLARKLRVAERDIGYAGMKDSVGITRQNFSIPGIGPEKVMECEFEGITILSATRHGNKFKLGHLKGNRFTVVVRQVTSGAAETTAAVLDVLARRGVPNWFGYQRYGIQANSHLIGAAMVRRDWQGAVDRLIGEPLAVTDPEWQDAIAAYRSGDVPTALRLMPRHCRTERDLLQRLVQRPEAWEKAIAAVHPRLKRLYLSAYQSSLFDRILERRLATFDRVVTGDLAWKHANGACFIVADPEKEQLRAEQLEISPTGPLFGARMAWPTGEILALERDVLAAEDISPTAFDLGGGLRMEGQRRPLRVVLEEPSWSIDGTTLRLQFSLPKGSYATAVVREITKNF